MSQQPDEQEFDLVPSEISTNVNTALLNSKVSYVIHNNQIYYKNPKQNNRFFKPEELLQKINNMTLITDTVIGIAASASDTFDNYIQSNSSLKFLVPTYLGAILILPSIYLASRHKWFSTRDGQGRQLLELPPEDNMMLLNSSDQIKNKSIEIKIERNNTKSKATYLTHTPTFLANAAIHFTYVGLLLFATEPTWFVENFDWLGPTIVGGMMLSLSLFTKYCYREKEENKFAEHVAEFSV